MELNRKITRIMMYEILSEVEGKLGLEKMLNLIDLLDEHLPEIPDSDPYKLYEFSQIVSDFILSRLENYMNIDREKIESNSVIYDTYSLKVKDDFDQKENAIKNYYYNREFRNFLQEHSRESLHSLNIHRRNQKSYLHYFEAREDSIILNRNVMEKDSPSGVFFYHQASDSGVSYSERSFEGINTNSNLDNLRRTPSRGYINLIDVVDSVCHYFDRLNSTYDDVSSCFEEYKMHLQEAIDLIFNNLAKDHLSSAYSSIFVSPSNISNEEVLKSMEENDISVFVKEPDTTDLVKVKDLVSVHSSNLEDESTWIIKPISCENEETCVGVGRVTEIVNKSDRKGFEDQSEIYVVENYIHTTASHTDFVNSLPDEVLILLEKCREIKAELNLSDKDFIPNEPGTSEKLFFKVVEEKVRQKETTLADLLGFYMNYKSYLDKINDLKNKILEEEKVKNNNTTII